MNTKRLFLAAITGVSLSFSASAADFFSTDEPDQLFRLGVRMGLNTSNTSTDFAKYGVNIGAWGTGFDAGAVCDIYFREWISVQPGIFFQSRTNDFTYIQDIGNIHDMTSSSIKPVHVVQAGHWRSYNIVVPVMASAHFNVTDNIRWSVEVGPYANFSLGYDRVNRALIGEGADMYSNDVIFNDDPASVTAGVKIGTGLEFLNHYYFGIHYMNDVTGAWKGKKIDTFMRTFNGKTKAWTFTIGYNF